MSHPYIEAARTWFSAHHSWTFIPLPISCSHLVRQRSLDSWVDIAGTSRSVTLGAIVAACGRWLKTRESYRLRYDDGHPLRDPRINQHFLLMLAQNYPSEEYMDAFLAELSDAGMFVALHQTLLRPH